MTIVPHADRFVIQRGGRKRREFFCFFVDDTGSLRSKTVWNARHFESMLGALSSTADLRRRENQRRAERQERG